MRATAPVFNHLGGWVLLASLGLYFSRIERFHGERGPHTGPVLFTSNHPNSITDAFVIGALVPRKLSFVGSVLLFRLAPLLRRIRSGWRPARKAPAQSIPAPGT